MGGLGHCLAGVLPGLGQVLDAILAQIFCNLKMQKRCKLISGSLPSLHGKPFVFAVRTCTDVPLVKTSMHATLWGVSKLPKNAKSNLKMNFPLSESDR